MKLLLAMKRRFITEKWVKITKMSFNFEYIEDLFKNRLSTLAIATLLYSRDVVNRGNLLVYFEVVP